MKAFFHLLGAGRIAALICCGVLAVAALFLKFAVPGYSFSALVCLCLIGIILFYTLFPLVGLKFPAFAKAVQTAVTVILAVGVLVVGITEGIIIHASFGNPEEPGRPVGLVVGSDLRRLHLSGRASKRDRGAFRRSGYGRANHRGGVHVPGAGESGH